MVVDGASRDFRYGKKVEVDGASRDFRYGKKVESG